MNCIFAASSPQYLALLWIGANSMVSVFSVWSCLKVLTVFRLSGGVFRNFFSHQSGYLFALPQIHQADQGKKEDLDQDAGLVDLNAEAEEAAAPQVSTVLHEQAAAPQVSTVQHEQAAAPQVSTVLHEVINHADVSSEEASVRSVSDDLSPVDPIRAMPSQRNDAFSKDTGVCTVETSAHSLVVQREETANASNLSVKLHNESLDLGVNPTVHQSSLREIEKNMTGA
jgi:hypothetical protein